MGEIVINEARQRVFSTAQIAGAAFLGTPIAGSWLIAENYKTFGIPGRARMALFGGAFATLATAAAAALLPEDFPDLALRTLYIIVVYLTAQTLQGELVDQYLRDGWVKHSNWRVAGIGLAFALVVWAFLVGLIFALPLSLWTMS